MAIVGNFPVNALTRSQLDSLMEKMNPDLVPVAAAAGDATIIKEFLDRCPREVQWITRDVLMQHWVVYYH